ncbi:MAG TPA: GNAT family N-acetyltransferase [Polyangiaceae bacterium]|nr:GNAT family N-acetyltransferase [Polyangiaceae bacterium]
MTAFEIERLSASDTADNVALARSVGWKDVEAEWRVLHEAAEVRGVRQAGRLVAQGALGDYGSAASLSKMIVAAEFQRRGLGARLLDGFLAGADARGVPVGLCATDQGRPLYESRQFSVTGELLILFGTPDLGTEPGQVDVCIPDAERLVVLDREFCGCDRSAMLRARFREACAKLELVGEERGFGLASPQGEHTLVGPISAETEAGARRLARAIFAAAPGPVRIDVPREHAEFRRWLVSFGLREVSERVEMARGSTRLPWQVPQRFALATQAWG